MNVNRIITTIDTHIAGQPTRVVTSGLPYIPGKSMQEKKAWMVNNEEDLRKMLKLIGSRVSKRNRLFLMLRPEKSTLRSGWREVGPIWSKSMKKPTRHAML